MKNYEEKFYLENFFVPFFSLIIFVHKKQREEEETMGHS